MRMYMLNHVWLLVTPWTVAGQAPLFMGFSRQKYWSGLPFPPPGDLPDNSIKNGKVILKSWPIFLCTRKSGVEQVLGLIWWLSGKESACQCRRCGFDLWVRKIPWGRKWQPTAVFFHGELHGQRSLVGHSPWGRKGPDTAEWLNNNNKSGRVAGRAVSRLYFNIPVSCLFVCFLNQAVHPDITYR